MNYDRKFKEKKSQLLEVLGLGMPAVVIMETLAISQSTLSNYFSRVVSSREYEDTKIVSLKEAKPKMLLLFAQLTIVPQKVLYRGEKNKLREALANALEEQKILETLGYALPHILSFSQPKFTDDVPKTCQNLIKDFVGQECKGIEQAVWQDWLSKLTQHETPLLSVERFQWGSSHFVHEIIASYAEETRKYVAPIYTKEVIYVVDKVMNSLVDRDYDIFAWVYGFYGEIKTYKEIAQSKRLSRERVKQLHSSIKMRVKKWYGDALRLSTWQENYLLKVQHQAELDRTEKMFKEAMLPSSEVSMSNVEDYAKLLLPIKDLGVCLSTRLENIFKTAEVNYLWEIVSRSEDDLMRFRTFGKKSLREVRELAEYQGYKIGMKFLPAEIAYFEAMTYGKEPRKRY